jgi:hypothetical protein
LRQAHRRATDVRTRLAPAPLAKTQLVRHTLIVAHNANFAVKK